MTKISIQTSTSKLLTIAAPSIVIAMFLHGCKDDTPRTTYCTDFTTRDECLFDPNEGQMHCQWIPAGNATCYADNDWFPR